MREGLTRRAGWESVLRSMYVYIYRCTCVGIHARSRWFVHPIDHILLRHLLPSHYCETLFQGRIYAWKKYDNLRATSLKATFRVRVFFNISASPSRVFVWSEDLRGINVNRYVYQIGVVVSPIMESISLSNLDIVRPFRTSFDETRTCIFHFLPAKVPRIF